MTESVNDLSASNPGWPETDHDLEHSIGDGEPVIYKHLNFKVPPEFHRDFKTWAASHDLSMTALLMEAFDNYTNSENKEMKK